MNNKKARILILGYLPPPPEGTAKITEVVINSGYLRDRFNMSFLPLVKRHAATLRGKLSLNNILINFLNYLRYAIRIISFNPEIVYMTLAQNRFGFLRDSIFIILGKLAGKKVAVHFHGGNFDLFYAQQKPLFKKYISIVLGKIDRLIVLADKFKLQFKGIVDQDRIDTLYNCLPESCQLAVAGNNWPKGDKIRVLFLGYLSKAKGALDVAQAVPLVISKYEKPIEFILCGQPVDIERNITFIPEPHYGYSKILSLIKDEELGEYVKVREKLDPGEKETLLASADIFVFPTYSEGCGLVALEAMARGLPIITTRVGALSEMLKENENCLFVEPGKAKDLADKAVWLSQHLAEAKEMGKAGRNCMIEKFNRSALADQFIVVFEELINNG